MICGPCKETIGDMATERQGAERNTEIIAYTDGACSGNPGPGGWGVLLQAVKAGSLLKERELSGGESRTTNNRMEMTAAIKALECLSRSTRIRLHTDSQYLKNGITDWIRKWRANGWRTATKKPVKNSELWQRLDKLCQEHDVEWIWLKGHAGIEGNERADAIARLGMKPYLDQSRGSRNERRSTEPAQGTSDDRSVIHDAREDNKPDIASEHSGAAPRVEVIAYTDGACSGNPGPGGWGVLLQPVKSGSLPKERELSGGESRTTNNRMEMTAAIKALECLPSSTRIRVHTDSQYLKNGITDWIRKWRANGWRTASKTPVKNSELWRRLDELCQVHDVEWIWLKGHAGIEGNERADALARSGMKPYRHQSRHTRKKRRSRK